MELNGDALYTVIKGKFDTLTASIDFAHGSYPSNGAYNEKFDQGLKEYLTANLTCTFVWAAVIPGTPPTPDPVTSMSATISWSTFSIGAPSSFSTWGSSIQSAIVGGILSPQSGFTVTLAPLSPVSPLVLVQGGDLKNICNQIITWVKTLISSGGPGSHASYIGAATAGVVS